MFTGTIISVFIRYQVQIRRVSDKCCVEGGVVEKVVALLVIVILGILGIRGW